VDEHGLVKLLDFGLAKLTGEARISDATTMLQTESPNKGLVPRTMEGMLVGTVAYMSPEQAEGKPVDARSDIFSFGALLYEMFTGRRAFQGDSMGSIIAAILRDEPKLPSQIAARLPVGVEHVIEALSPKVPCGAFPAYRCTTLLLIESSEPSARKSAKEAGRKPC
jgi:serine/threonine protein kinase